MTTELNNTSITMLTEELHIKEKTEEEIEEELLAKMLDYSTMKKPKKKSKKTPKASPPETPNNEDPAALATTTQIADIAPPATQSIVNNYGYEYDPPNYEFAFLLDRFYAIMPQQSQQLRKKLPKQPITKKAGKKTHWTNIYHCADSVNRKLEHLQQFILAELSTTGTLNGTYCLIILGRYEQPKIEFVFKKYIVQYVQCENCKGLDSNLEKDSITNLPTIKCNNCKSDRRVCEISSGYYATMRGDRKKSRQQS